MEPYIDAATVDIHYTKHHATYLKSHNRRTEYLAIFWNIVNWQVVERRFNEIK